MCYYDVYHFSCQDWEWGGLVSHCSNVGKPGQYCAGNMAASIVRNTEQCPCCAQLAAQRKRIDAMEQEWWNFSFIGGVSSRHEKKINAAKMELRELEMELNEMRFRKEGSRFAMLSSMSSLAQQHAASQKTSPSFAAAPQVVTSLSLPPPVTVVGPSSPTHSPSTSLSSFKGPGSTLSRSSTSTGSSADRELRLVSTWEDDEPTRKPTRTKSVLWIRKRLREYADELKRDMSFEDD